MHSYGDIRRKTPKLFLYQAVNMFIVAVLSGGQSGFDFSGASLLWHNEEVQFLALASSVFCFFCFGQCVHLF